MSWRVRREGKQKRREEQRLSNQLQLQSKSILQRKSLLNDLHWHLPAVKLYISKKNTKNNIQKYRGEQKGNKITYCIGTKSGEQICWYPCFIKNFQIVIWNLPLLAKIYMSTHMFHKLRNYTEAALLLKRSHNWMFCFLMNSLSVSSLGLYSGLYALGMSSGSWHSMKMMA